MLLLLPVLSVVFLSTTVGAVVVSVDLGAFGTVDFNQSSTTAATSIAVSAKGARRFCIYAPHAVLVLLPQL